MTAFEYVIMGLCVLAVVLLYGICRNLEDAVFALSAIARTIKWMSNDISSSIDEKKGD